MNKLWQLSNEIAILEEIASQKAEANDQEEALKVFSEWLEKQQDLDNSILSLADYIRYLEALSEARKKEAQRLSKLSQESSNRAKGLRDYLARIMLERNKPKVEGVKGKVSLRTNPKKVTLTVDVEALPAHLCRVDVAPDLEQIRKLLMESDEEVRNFATFSEPTYSINIK